MHARLRRRRELSIVLVAAIAGVVGAVGLPLAAPSPIQAVGGTCPTADFAGGTGTLADPFLVSTATQLAAINDVDCLAKAFVQTGDIDLAGITWSPIGTAGNTSNGFTGVFYGACYAIDNLTIANTSSSTDELALFSRATAATFRNVRLTDVNVTSAGSYVGGLVGDLNQTGGVETHILESSVTGSVTGDSQVGLIAGDGSDDSVGTRLHSSGSVDATSTGGSAGGLVGDAFTALTESYSTASVKAGLRAGGLSAYSYSSNTYSNNYATGSITVGNSGNSETNGAGGLFGAAGGDTEISKSYASGSVSHSTTPTTAKLGGLVGTIPDNYGELTYTDAFWDSQTTNQAVTALKWGGYPTTSLQTTTTGAQSTASMKTSNTFVSWDPTIWNITSGAYPTLKWFDDGGLTNCQVTGSVSPSSGSAGQSVTITGTGFTGITNVTFGGVPATFTVVDDTHITAVLPAGSGTVDVVASGVRNVDVNRNAQLNAPVLGKVGTFTYISTDNGGGGTPAPEPTPTPTPTPTATTTPVVSPVIDPLDPVNGTTNPNIPTGGLPQGGSLLLVNGVPQPLTVVPDAKKAPTGLDISGDGWKMKLVGRGDDGDPLGLTEKQALILQSDVITDQRAYVKKVAPVAQASGDGFKSVSPVKFYLLDTSTYLGELITDESGSFSGKIPVPAGIKPGGYTLQMNGYAPNEAVRSLSIGVIVKPTTVAVRTFKAATKVYFASMDPTLDAKAKAELRALVKKTGKSGVRTAVVGYVQPTSVASNDQSLSTARAKNVAAYLRSLGLKGAYAVRGDGKAQQTGATARRVNVSVTYTR